MISIVTIAGLFFAIGALVVLWRYPNALSLLVKIVVVMLVLIILFWELGIVAFCIAALAMLAAQVVFGRISGSTALSRGVYVLLLCLILTWLAIDIAKPLFFNSQSQLVEFVREALTQSRTAFSGEASPTTSMPPFFWAIVGLSLVATSLVVQSPVATTVTLVPGLILTLSIGLPQLLIWIDRESGYVPVHPFRPVLIFALAAFFVGGAVKLLRSKN